MAFKYYKALGGASTIQQVSLWGYYVKRYYF
jgi:hypothetical protein